MIRGSVRMIDDPAQRTGLVVKVGEQRRELCFGNRVYRGHTLRSLRSWLIGVRRAAEEKVKGGASTEGPSVCFGGRGREGPPFIAAMGWHDARAVRALEPKGQQDFLQRVTLRSHWCSARQFRFDTEYDGKVCGDVFKTSIDAQTVAISELGQPNIASLESVSPTFALERRC
jgi:hypothetical protein